MASYYVDSTAGVDGDGSLLNPWNNIDGHVADLAAGDFMYLRGNVAAPGQVYAEDIDIGAGCADGTAVNPITITPYNNEYVIIRAAGGGWRDIFDFVGRDYWIIDGLDSDDPRIVVDKQGNGGLAFDLNDSDHITLRDLEIKDGAYYAIEIDDGSDYALIEGCTIHTFNAGAYSDAHGIYIRGGANATVTQCVIYDCRGDCVQVEQDGDLDSVDDLTVSYCELYVNAAIADCVENAIDIKDGAGHHFHHNTLHGFRHSDGSCGGSGGGASAAAIIIQTYVSSNIIVEHNTFYDCPTAVRVSSDDVIVRWNTIYELANDTGATSRAAIFVHAADNVDIYHNVIEDCYRSFNLTSSATDVTLRNNVIHTGGIITDGGATYSADYNCWHNCTDTLAGAHDVNADPQFVSVAAHNYHLQVGSPCIDAGVNLGFPFYGSAPDMGRYEYETGVLIIAMVVVTVTVVTVVAA